jgi:prepilin-type processing-associated H-X9-DG protein
MQLQEKQQSRIDNPLWFCPKNKGTMRDELGNDNRNISFNSAWGIYTKRDYALICDDGIAGSYGINGWVLDVPATGGGLTESRTRVDHWRTPYVKQAGEIPLMTEALRFDVWPQPTQRPFDIETDPWNKDGGNHMARVCMNRHLGHVNVAMCDFSVRRVGVKELYTLKWHRTFNTSGPWTIAGGVVDTQWPEWIRPFKDF